MKKLASADSNYTVREISRIFTLFVVEKLWVFRPMFKGVSVFKFERENRLVSSPYDDSFDSSTRLKGVASQISTLPYAIATFITCKKTENMSFQ